ncbi:hypothetical protein [Salmonella phage vB_SenM-S16]|uniref:Uncharacterized protein n=1 Tax=Salmonella phage S16 TaxID=1087482 RepID=M1GU90_BPS16|nr:hypothetical protein I133_gp056 [Salmonella phage vB_SenM-S16]AGE48205.1 hypothetical protein [Salmonella phage vB_SenM-S16]
MKSGVNDGPISCFNYLCNRVLYSKTFYKIRASALWIIKSKLLNNS